MVKNVIHVVREAAHIARAEATGKHGYSAPKTASGYASRLRSEIALMRYLTKSSAVARGGWLQAPGPFQRNILVDAVGIARCVLQGRFR